MSDKIIRKYIKNTVRNCPFAFRKRLKVDLYNSLCNYCDEHPNVTEADLVSAFGEPADYGAEYIAGLDDQARVKFLRRNTIIKFVVVLLLIIMTVLFVIGTSAVVYDVFNSEVYYLEEFITYEK